MLLLCHCLPLLLLTMSHCFEACDLVCYTLCTLKYFKHVGEVKEMKKVKMDMYFPAETSPLRLWCRTMCFAKAEAYSLPNSKSGHRKAQTIKSNHTLNLAMTALNDAMVNCGISASNSLFFMTFHQWVAATEDMLDWYVNGRSTKEDGSVKETEIPPSIEAFGESFAKKIHPKTTLFTYKLHWPHDWKGNA